jgi:hypothetical protein
VYNRRGGCSNRELRPEFDRPQDGDIECKVSDLLRIVLELSGNYMYHLL